MDFYRNLEIADDDESQGEGTEEAEILQENA